MDTSAVFIFQFLKHHKISKELGLDAEKLMIKTFMVFMGAMCVEELVICCFMLH